ncbi:MAG TPA: exonuclease domain-containing protein [Microbacteriaceae bacterium]|nr:exonuclease domain-containing protein [Microbacteriaceae bacterium]
MTAALPDLIVFDTETTGVDVRRDRIVSAHIGRLSPSGELSWRADWIIDPGVPIPEGAAAVHGITTERAQAEGENAASAVAAIISTLTEHSQDGSPLVAYNASYDLTLLAHEAERYGLERFEPRVVIDPLIIDKAVDRYRKGKRTLTAACEVYGVPLEDAHEASADAVAAGRLALALFDRFPELSARSLEELHAQQVVWQRDQAESFAAWKRSNGSPDFVADVGWPTR